MEDLLGFFEKKLNQKISLYEYKSQNLKDNQEIVYFGDKTYVIEIVSDEISEDINGNFYYLYQENLDIDLLSGVLNSLFDNIKIINYNGDFLISSNCNDLIDSSTPMVIESETYSKTYLLNLGYLDSKDDLLIKVNTVKSLLPYIFRENSSDRYFNINDMAIYKLINCIDTDESLSNLVNFEKIAKIDTQVLETGLKFIENGLNIAKTSNAMFLHRNTLIYRLDKIKEVLEIDLKDFKESMIFYLSVKSYFMKSK